MNYLALPEPDTLCFFDEQTGEDVRCYSKELVYVAIDADRAQRAAPEVQVVGMRNSKYVDSTPKLHVGSSSFEDWYQAHEKACTGDKQLARDAYAAGMGDPLVTYSQPPQQSAQPEPMRTHVEKWALGLGWKKEDGEGAFEFVQRTSYAQGWQDGRREGLGDIHRDTPVAWAFQFADGNWDRPSLTEHSSGMRPLYPAAQPVEVQRVPITRKQLHFLLEKHFGLTEQVNDEDESWVEAMALVAAIEAHHGIKPSSEGGAA